MVSKIFGGCYASNLPKYLPLFPDSGHKELIKQTLAEPNTKTRYSLLQPQDSGVFESLLQYGIFSQGELLNICKMQQVSQVAEAAGMSKKQVIDHYLSTWEQKGLQYHRLTENSAHFQFEEFDKGQQAKLVEILDNFQPNQNSFIGRPSELVTFVDRLLCCGLPDEHIKPSAEKVLLAEGLNGDRLSTDRRKRAVRLATDIACMSRTYSENFTQTDQQVLAAQQMPGASQSGINGHTQQNKP